MISIWLMVCVNFHISAVLPTAQVLRGYGWEKWDLNIADTKNHGSSLNKIYMAHF
jgi:hypothetical protein